ncbi:MAG: hypothetical protein ABIG37_00260 [Nanoarchaeota archaeon]
MSNDNGLVDEFAKIQETKKQIEEKEKELKNKIIELSKEKNTDVLFGNNKKCSIKEYDKVIFPEDKTLFVQLIKSKGLYNKFSSVNYLKLSPAIVKDEIDKEIAELTKKEKAFRLSLRDI